ncbi:hypothetical protein L9F63_020303, partial [Diploptera punctata]
ESWGSDKEISRNKELITKLPHTYFLLIQVASPAHISYHEYTIFKRTHIK